jgi:hypothetical protein
LLRRAAFAMTHEAWEIGESATGPARPAPVALECSSTQRRIWFTEQLRPGTSAYNVKLALRIDGGLDVEVLRRCLNEIVDRHSVLRASFRAVDGRPRPVVDGKLTPSMPATDLSGRQDGYAQAIRLAAREAAEPFDLERGPLFRARIIRVATDRHVLCWTAHHLVFDDWSYWLMVRELTELYPALRAGQRSPLPPLPLQYWDYASWQRRRLLDPASAPELAYWRGALAGAPPRSTFPPDVPRTAAPAFRGARRSYALSAQLTSAIDKFAQRERITAFMVLLTALQALLHRCSGQDDVVIGVATAGRDRVEFEELVGPFVNTLPIRVTSADNMPFLELLRRVRTATIEAYQHQETPFDRLVEELRPPRRASMHPLYQVMLAVQDAPFAVSELSGLVMESVPLDSDYPDQQLCTAVLDLTLCLKRDGSQFAGELEYNAALFQPGTAERLLRRFTGLLEQAVAHPELPLIQLLPVRTEAIDLALRALAARSRPRPAAE